MRFREPALEATGVPVVVRPGVRARPVVSGLGGRWGGREGAALRNAGLLLAMTLVLGPATDLPVLDVNGYRPAGSLAGRRMRP